MTPPPEGGCCKCIISFTITSAFAAFFIWLSLRPSNPTCSIEQLNLTQNNTMIHYDLKLKNKNNDKGIYYNTLNLTFYYKNNTFGNASYEGFYQGHGKSTHRVGDVVVSKAGVKWKNGVVVVFRVKVETVVKFKIVFLKVSRRPLVVGAELKVDGQGVLVKRKKNKGIKLKSCGRKIVVNGLSIHLLISLIVSVYLL